MEVHRLIRFPGRMLLVLLVGLVGCAATGNSGATKVVWIEGENVASSRKDVSMIADPAKTPASGGAVLYGQVLSIKDATATWTFDLPAAISDARVHIRYGRLHWRATMQPAQFALEIIDETGASAIQKDVEFGPTRGWGTKPGDYGLLAVDLGPLPASRHTLRLTSKADGTDLSVDGFLIAPTALELTADELNRASRIAIDSNSYVGIASPSILRQNGRQTVHVVRRAFTGKPPQVQAMLAPADGGTKRPLKPADESSADGSTLAFQLSPDDRDGNYVLSIENLEGVTVVKMPVVLAGEMAETIGPRLERIRAFAHALADREDAASDRATFEHLIALIEASQSALGDGDGADAGDGNIRRQGLAEQEGAAATPPMLERTRRALEQAEQTIDRMAMGKETPPGEYRMAYRSAVDGRLAVYRLFIPSSYSKAEKVPTILFLHGGGGDENYWPEMQDGQILKMLEERGYIGIMPHWHRRNFGEHWMEDQLQLLDEVRRNWPKVDPDRIYLTGISMGGGGSFQLAANHPEMFAAICCVSGPGDPEQAEELKGLPVMLIHGGADTVSPAERAIRMYERYKSLGQEVVMHLFELHGHNYHAERYMQLTLDWFDKHVRSSREP